MCNKRSTTTVMIGFKKEVRVDACMKKFIDTLDCFRIKTVACCCGHGRYPMTVIARYPGGNLVELLSGKIIPRKKRFYKTDKNGFYYIPEVSKPPGNIPFLVGPDNTIGRNQEAEHIIIKPFDRLTELIPQEPVRGALYKR